jgi:stage II sporulation protein D
MRALRRIALPKSQPPIGALLACAAAALAMLATAAPAAEGKVIWRIKGAANGHGVGMSQWGAFGFAKHGAGYREILGHYYRGTEVSTTSPQTVRVLLRPFQKVVKFRDASSACGKQLAESKTYYAKRKASAVILRNAKGVKLANCGGLMRATGGKSVVLLGKGSYRGALEARPSTVAGELNAINGVGLDDYVRGVVPPEMPTSWPLSALRAQAVAARSYALASSVGGRGFEQYDDTRSQVYGGLGVETPRSNTAVNDTTNQVVTYKGKIAQTFFFSTSGGHTENNENVFLGGAPRAYLRGVPDPYDGASPYHRWRRKLSQGRMQRALGGLVRGKLRKIRVTKRGVSPRIVRAKLIGSRGVTKVRGQTLKSRLKLYDVWVYFKKVKR